MDAVRKYQMEMPGIKNRRHRECLQQAHRKLDTVKKRIIKIKRGHKVIKIPLHLKKIGQ